MCVQFLAISRGALSFLNCPPPPSPSHFKSKCLIDCPDWRTLLNMLSNSCSDLQAVVHPAKHLFNQPIGSQSSSPVVDSFMHSVHWSVSIQALRWTETVWIQTQMYQLRLDSQPTWSCWLPSWRFYPPMVEPQKECLTLSLPLFAHKTSGERWWRAVQVHFAKDCLCSTCVFGVWVWWAHVGFYWLEPPSW